MNIIEESPYLNSRLDLFSHKLTQLSNTTQDDYLIVEPYSIGDAVHTLSLLSAFRNKFVRTSERINFICNKRALPIVKLFRNVDNAIGIDLGPFEFHLEAIAERYGSLPKGKPIPMAPDMYTKGWLGKLREKVTPIQAKSLILELDIDTEPSIPELDPELLTAMFANFRAAGIERNSVIIFNHANTMREVDSSIFRPLQRKFPRVYYDSSISDKGIIPWARPVKIRLDEIPFLTSYIGTAVIIRSGITDIVALSSARVISIYPNSCLVYDWSGKRTQVAKTFRELTLEKLGLAKNVREFPMFCEEGDSMDDLESKFANILSNIPEI